MVFISRIALPVLLLLAWFLVPGRTQAQSAQPACGRIAILLAGYNTSSADVPGTFRDIVSGAMAGNGYASPAIDFSYRYPSPYTPAATYDALPSHAVKALHRTVVAQLARCPSAQIDLIGHSLGGAVALRYITGYGTTPEGSHIRHVITLDSPVNGTSYSRLVVAAALLGQSRLVGSPTGLYLAAQSRDPQTRAANASLVRQLAPHTTIRTLESADDWIVPAGDAEIAGASQQFHLGRNYAACTRGINSIPSCLGHDRILHDARALTAIRAILTS